MTSNHSHKPKECKDYQKTYCKRKANVLLNIAESLVQQLFVAYAYSL